jgi:hypothetical protein
MVEQMNKVRIVGIFVVTVLFWTMFAKGAWAQTGQRYAEPVFDEVNIETGIPFSSAIKEGATSPTTLYLDFYEPMGDTLSERPLVITVFGGAFVAGSRDYSDMVEYCTRLAKHGYAAASIDYRLISIWNISSTALIRDAYMAAQDVSAAIRFFKYHCDEYRIDTKQVFLLGNSAGSIAILCELFMDENERPAETFEEPDLGSMHSSGYDEYAGFSPAVAGAIPQWGGVMDLDVIDVEEYVPLCMLHGTDDTNVPYDSGYCYNGMLPGVMPFMYGSHPIAGRLDEIGITDYEFHSFEGEGHAFYFIPLLFTLIEEKFDTCFSIARDFLYEHLNVPVAVPERDKQNIQIYPNPATDLVTISFDETMSDESFTFVIMDVTGRKMLEKASSSHKITIDVSQWPSGVYALRIERNGFSSSRKIVKR